MNRLSPRWHSSHFCFPNRKLNKRQRNRVLDKEGEKYVTNGKGFFHISGVSFQCYDKLSAGICSKWISHYTLRNRGFRMVAGKRAISATGMSAVSNPLFELLNTMENHCKTLPGIIPAWHHHQKKKKLCKRKKFEIKMIKKKEKTDIKHCLSPPVYMKCEEMVFVKVVIFMLWTWRSLFQNGSYYYSTYSYTLCYFGGEYVKTR